MPIVPPPPPPPALVRSADAPAPGEGSPLTTVVPQLAGKNHVRWWEFDWKWTDFRPVEGGAPVRLYFYDSERPVTPIVQASIEQVYREYAGTFEFTPDARIPFLLYNSHFEFESTNAFLVSEGVLGVTSTYELSVSLPYWGEHERFLFVLRHELAHEFTLQKIAAAARKAKTSDPVQDFPGWFMEGLAQRYAYGGLDPDARAVLADAVLGLGKKGPKLPGFFDDAPDFERVYRIGHAQVVFLDDVYGEGTSIRILQESPWVTHSGRTFTDLVQKVTGDPAKVIEQRWRAWVADVAGAGRASAETIPERVHDAGRGEPDSISVSPDGSTIFYRTFDRTTGRARLLLRDAKDGKAVQVVEDERPGLVSLHPLDRRVTAIGDHLLAWIGRVAATDVIFIRRWRRVGKGFELGPVHTHRIAGTNALIEAGYPAFAPDEHALAFVGLSRTGGFQDLYRLESPLGKTRITRLTDDEYSVRGLAWAADGSLVYASDATPDNHYALFQRRGNVTMALTDLPRGVDAIDPSPDGQGGFVFTSDAGGTWQAYRLAPAPPAVACDPRQPVAGVSPEVRRLSTTPTSFSSPVVLGDGSVLGVFREGGESTLARLAPAQFTDLVLPAAVPAPSQAMAPAAPLPRAPLTGVHDYDIFRPSNYHVTGLNLGLTNGFFFGATQLQDRFNNHIAGAQVFVLGNSIDRTEADIFAIDLSHRVSRGIDLFAHASPRLDPNGFFYLLRRTGGTLLLSYPFGFFSRIDASLTGEAIQPFAFEDPTSPIRRDIRGTLPAAALGLSYALDTTRPGLPGPIAGVSIVASVAETVARAPAGPFTTTFLETNAYQPLYEGLFPVYFAERLAGGTSVGGDLREQFYLPAAYNIRAYSDGSLDVLGYDYGLGTLELHFPLLPFRSFPVYVEGLAGADVGAIAFDSRDLYDARTADGVLGTRLIFGPIALRLDFARPVDIGAGVPQRGWLTHFTLGLPFLTF